MRGNRKFANKSRGFIKRLLTAAISVDVPVWPYVLMALHPDLHTARVSTTLKPLLFGFGMSWFLEKSQTRRGGVSWGGFGGRG